MIARARTVWLLATLLAGGGACGGVGPDTQHVALAPRSLPTPRTGQGMTGVIEAALSAGPVAEWTEPTLDPSAAVHVPALQGRADVRFQTRGIPGLELGFIHERGLPYYARELRADAPSIEKGASSVGLSIYYSSRHTANFHIGWGLDTQLFLVPFVHYQLCQGMACEAPFTVVEQGRSVRPVLSASITPSYRLPAGFSLFWGLTARNHPSIAPDGEAGVDTGPFSLVAAGGLSYTHAGTGVRGAVHAYHSFRGRPVEYAPAIALSLSIPIFRESRAQPLAPPTTP